MPEKFKKDIYSAIDSYTIDVTQDHSDETKLTQTLYKLKVNH
jgi:hypothetical protein